MELKIIQLQSENLGFYSNYVPLISFKNKKQKEATEDYILEQVKDFFKKVAIELDIDKNQLPYQKNITEEDFKKIDDISYFYENLFYDLGERGSDNKLKVKIKWGITFDEKCVPCYLGSVNPGDGNSPDIKKERRYGTIDINGTPVFYYIYFTLQEILDVIKKI
ncbi:hypothetical protein [Coleofasciculus sp. FACHB-SPT36]|uniref:hypothetical protein n=1 Tax=Cyanophyceae TaxID=3028117 RepID=UPI00168BE167|nr:hypothetical protein [Coleofasciculus sp. FACHB-SPT36]MBD2541044.1 hypothetical protein [Coleofasciculus sp. FACHB-SPT36]